MRWNNFARFCASLGIAALVSLPALADQVLDQENACYKGSGDVKIEACTWVIQSGRWVGADSAWAFHNRAHVYELQGQYALAIQDLDQAIALKPNSPEEFYDRGWAYAHMGQDARAIQDYDQAINLRPEFEEALFNRGNAYMRLKQYASAIRNYDRVIQLDPNAVAAINNRDTAQKALSAQPPANTSAPQSELTAQPAVSDALSDQADACANSAGQTKIDACTWVIQSGQWSGADLAWAFNDRCWALAASGEQLQTALTDCNKALALQPKAAAALQSRGLVYFRLGNYQAATSDEGAAAALDPKMAGAFFVRGLAKLKAGDAAGGNADIAAANAIDPTIDAVYATYGISAAAPQTDLAGSGKDQMPVQGGDVRTSNSEPGIGAQLWNSTVGAAGNLNAKIVLAVLLLIASIAAAVYFLRSAKTSWPIATLLLGAIVAISAALAVTYFAPTAFLDLFRSLNAAQTADIGSSSGDDIIAKRISADGSTVVGVAQDTDDQKHRAFRWTQASGLQYLEFQDEDKTKPYSDATGVSADGSVVVGHRSDAQGIHHVYRWTAASGVEDVGAPSGLQFLSDPVVSNDGTAVAGSYLVGQPGKSHLYVWTKALGLQDLGSVALAVVPVAVSNDGSVISGWFRNENDTYGIFQWTRSAGFQKLGTIGKAGCEAVAASADGSVIVGYSWDKVALIEGIPDPDSTIGGNVFRWTRATGIRDLGTMGAVKAIPQGLSADGTTILGARTDKKNGWQAFMWTEAGGVRAVGSTNWHDASATDISADGSLIVGHYNDVDLDPDNRANPPDRREHFFIMSPTLVAEVQEGSQPASKVDEGQTRARSAAARALTPSRSSILHHLTLALVSDDRGNVTISPLFDASGSGRTYIFQRTLTQPGEIQDVTTAPDYQSGAPMLVLRLAPAARDRIHADATLQDQEVALELDSSSVLAVTTARALSGDNLTISGLTAGDITRIVQAISSDLMASEIPNLATAPKWTILDASHKFLSKSVYVEGKTGLIHLQYCSMEPCEPDDQVDDVQPATVDCRSETFTWSNFMDVTVSESLQGTHAVPRSSVYGLLIQGLCAQKETLRTQ